MPVELTSLARVHLLLVRHAERQGIGREELLRLAGLSEDLLEDPDARLPSTGVLRLWQLLAGRLRDPALGVHLLEGVRLRELGLVGYAMAFSPNLLDALRRLHRYVRILSETIQYELIEGERLAVAARSNPRGPSSSMRTGASSGTRSLSIGTRPAWCFDPRTPPVPSLRPITR